MAFTAVPAALTLIEPERVKSYSRMKFRDILNIFNYALFRNRNLRLNIIFSSITGSATLTMAWFAQLYFESVKLPVALYGVLWTALNFTVGLSSLIAHRVEDALGQAKIILLITVFLGGSYIALGVFSGYWTLIFLFVFYLVRGVATPVLKDYINKVTDSDVRATVLSVRNFIIRLLFSAIGPLLGYITGAFTLGSALILSGSTFLLAGLFIGFAYVNQNKDNT